MKQFLSAVLIFSILLISLPTAKAESETLTLMGKRGKVVGKAALYGFGGGLVVGLASQVFKKKAKNIFLFGSLGMYAGIILGIYVVSTSSGPAPYEGPDTYDDYGEFGYRLKALPRGGNLVATQERSFSQEPLKINLVNLKF